MGDPKEKASTLPTAEELLDPSIASDIEMHNIREAEKAKVHADITLQVGQSVPLDPHKLSSYLDVYSETPTVTAPTESITVDPTAPFGPPSAEEKVNIPIEEYMEWLNRLNPRDQKAYEKFLAPPDAGGRFSGETPVRWAQRTGLSLSGVRPASPDEMLEQRLEFGDVDPEGISPKKMAEMIAKRHPEKKEVKPGVPGWAGGMGYRFRGEPLMSFSDIRPEGTPKTPEELYTERVGLPTENISGQRVMGPPPEPVYRRGGPAWKSFLEIGEGTRVLANMPVEHEVGGGESFPPWVARKFAYDVGKGEVAGLAKMGQDVLGELPSWLEEHFGSPFMQGTTKARAEQQSDQYQYRKGHMSKEEYVQRRAANPIFSLTGDALYTDPGKTEAEEPDFFSRVWGAGKYEKGENWFDEAGKRIWKTAWIRTGMKKIPSELLHIAAFPFVAAYKTVDWLTETRAIDAKMNLASETFKHLGVGLGKPVTSLVRGGLYDPGVGVLPGYQREFSKGPLMQHLIAAPVVGWTGKLTGAAAKLALSARIPRSALAWLENNIGIHINTSYTSMQNLGTAIFVGQVLKRDALKYSSDAGMLDFARQTYAWTREKFAESYVKLPKIIELTSQHASPLWWPFQIGRLMYDRLVMRNYSPWAVKFKFWFRSPEYRWDAETMNLFNEFRAIQGVDDFNQKMTRLNIPEQFRPILRQVLQEGVEPAILTAADIERMRISKRAEPLREGEVGFAETPKVTAVEYTPKEQAAINRLTEAVKESKTGEVQIIEWSDAKEGAWWLSYGQKWQPRSFNPWSQKEESGGFRVNKDVEIVLARTDPAKLAVLRENVATANKYGRPVVKILDDLRVRGAKAGIYESPETLMKLWWPQVYDNMGMFRRVWNEHIARVKKEKMTPELQRAVLEAERLSEEMRKALDTPLNRDRLRDNTLREAGIPVHIREKVFGMSTQYNMEWAAVAEHSALVRYFELFDQLARSRRADVGPNPWVVTKPTKGYMEVPKELLHPESKASRTPAWGRLREPTLMPGDAIKFTTGSGKKAQSVVAHVSERGFLVDSATGQRLGPKRVLNMTAREVEGYYKTAGNIRVKVKGPALYLRHDILMEIMHGRKMQEALGKPLMVANRVFKAAKTTQNPATLARNIWSVFFNYMPMAGVSILNPAQWPFIIRATKEFVSKERFTTGKEKAAPGAPVGSVYRELHEQGLFRGDPWTAELAHNPTVEFLTGLVGHGKDAMWNVITAPYKLATGDLAGFSRSFKAMVYDYPGLLYGSVDNLGKYIVGKWLMEVKGMSAAEAASMSARQMLDYSRVAGIVEALRAPMPGSMGLGVMWALVGQPFITYVHKALPRYQKWMEEAPWTAAIWGGMYESMEIAQIAEMGLRPEAVRATLQLQHAYARERGVPMTFKKPKGELAHLYPGGFMVDTINLGWQGPMNDFHEHSPLWGQHTGWDYLSTVLRWQSPAATAMALINNLTPWMGQTIRTPGMPGEDWADAMVRQGGEVLTFLHSQFLPPQAPGGVEYGIVSKAFRGEVGLRLRGKKIGPLRAAMRSFGLKGANVRSFEVVGAAMSKWVYSLHENLRDAQKKFMEEKRVSVLLPKRMEPDDELLIRAMMGLTGRLSLGVYVEEMGLERVPDGKGGYRMGEDVENNVTSAVPHQNDAHLAVTSNALDAVHPLEEREDGVWVRSNEFDPPPLSEHTYEAAIEYFKANPKEQEKWAAFSRDIGIIIHSMRGYTIDVRTWIMNTQQEGEYE